MGEYVKNISINLLSFTNSKGYFFFPTDSAFTVLFEGNRMKILVPDQN